VGTYQVFSDWQAATADLVGSEKIQCDQNKYHQMAVAQAQKVLMSILLTQALPDTGFEILPSFLARQCSY
jgi:hypothetical protein